MFSWSAVDQSGLNLAIFYNACKLHYHFCQLHDVTDKSDNQAKIRIIKRHEGATQEVVKLFSWSAEANPACNGLELGVSQHKSN